ncbi:CPXCG motif-containing cysteine-rich protein [Alteromonas facilis]|uniref:CPXCG motif-containing cysteine-rich protein n=1 Tax=Alteromonas facilis TaxID=2048004 RepID=UPI000C287A03|nr:CPXCG motif-containing cysteine-rich protein [Alteromonas facilis]
MSLTDAAQFECPYCMVINDLEIDPHNDINQQQVVDCQICCQPIEIEVHATELGFNIIAKRDDE